MIAADHRYTSSSRYGSMEKEPLLQQLLDSDDKKSIAQGKRQVVGLPNIGNTCFLNSVLQCLFHCYPLHGKLIVCLREGRTLTITPRVGSPLQITLRPHSQPQCQPLASALCRLFHEMGVERRGPQDASLRKILHILGERNPNYRAMEQQDSAEVQRDLLDILRKEELKRMEVAIAGALHSTCKDYDEQRRQAIIRRYLRSMEQETVIDDVFGGSMQLVTTCYECHYVRKEENNFVELTVALCPIPQGSDDQTEGSVDCNILLWLWRIILSLNCPSPRSWPGIFFKSLSLIWVVCTFFYGGAVDEPEADHRRHKAQQHADTAVQCTSADTAISEQPKSDSSRDPATQTRSTTTPGPQTRSTTTPGPQTIEDCLQQYTHCEVIDGEHSLCQKCQENHASTFNSAAAATVPARNNATERKLDITSLPMILIINLKRFKVDRYHRLRKRSDPVIISDHLDVTPYCSDDLRQNSNIERSYSPFAIVSHLGSSLNGGHYITYVKLRRSRTATPESALDVAESLASPSDSDEEHQGFFGKWFTSYSPQEEEGWYRISDSTFRRCSQDEAFGACAYTIFYEQCKS